MTMIVLRKVYSLAIIATIMGYSPGKVWKIIIMIMDNGAASSLSHTGYSLGNLDVEALTL